MAKEGWEGYGEESHDEISDEEDASLGSPSAEKAKLEIVRLAHDLRDASRATRITYQHPRVKFILPRIKEGEDKSIDAVLADIRITGSVVICGQTTAQHQMYDSNHAPSSLPALFDRMLPSPSHPLLTRTLNIDCTILLALISDISHVSRSNLPASPSNPSGTYHTAIVKQIEAEETTPLLPSEVYEVLRGRRMVATALAAKRMREIVQTMGTGGEISRAGILLGESKFEGMGGDALRLHWQDISCWKVPEDFNLPIVVVGGNGREEIDAAGQPGQEQSHSLINRLTRSTNLSPVNAAVFLYGWRNDVVTVTSNKAVAVGIEKALNRLLDDDEQLESTRTADIEALESEVGPRMYICDTARSLIGKEKQNGLRP